MFGISSCQIKDVVNLSLPMAGSRFIQMFSGFLGMMMVAHLGRQVLAACALINATLSTLLLIFMSIVFAVSFVVGQTVGSKQYRAVGALVQQSLLLSLLLGFCMTILFWFAGDLVKLFHQTPAMVAYVHQYFHALMWGGISILLQTCLQQFLYGILKQRLVIIINLITLVIGVSTSYVLIFGHFGMPSLGVSGLAYGFVAQSWVGLLLILGVCFFSENYKEYALFEKHTHVGLVYFKKVFQVGWPMSVQFGGELLAFFVVAMMTGWLGVNALAAVQVTQQWLFLVIVPIFAMSEAGGILVGRAVGAKDCASLKDIGRASLLVVIAMVGLLDIFFLFFPDFFASFYLNITDPNNIKIISLIRILFIILTVTLILNGIRDVLSGLLRGLYDTQFPMRIGIFVMWGLVVPLGYLLAFTFHWGVVGFKIGGNIGILIGAIIIYWRWQKRVHDFEVMLANQSN